MMTLSYIHSPVMVHEIVDIFRGVPSGVVVDATLGGGGHSRAILESRDDVTVVGLDRDKVALDHSVRELASFSNRFNCVQTTFGNIAEVIEQHSRGQLSGVLFDFGVSSPQIDDPARGFSYRHDGPLDMRMDRDNQLTAFEVVNYWDSEELVSILRDYSDERFARRIVNAIVDRRPISSTLELAEIVTLAIPAASRKSGRHPAMRTFQAIRIAVNDELTQIRPAIIDALNSLVVGGRVVSLSYHSGEDRIVKRVFGEYSGAEEVLLPRIPIDTRVPSNYRLLMRGAKSASKEEMANNRRAESAKLRAIERISI